MIEAFLTILTYTCYAVDGKAVPKPKPAIRVCLEDLRNGQVGCAGDDLRPYQAVCLGEGTTRRVVVQTPEPVVAKPAVKQKGWR